MKPKSSVYLAVIIVSLLGIVGLVLVIGLQFTVSIEPLEPDLSLPEALPPQASPSGELFSTPPAKPKPANAPTASNSQPTGSVAAGIGGLRISNQTNQPVRVALLAQTGSNKADARNYGDAVHWDFAPGEGSRQGLILSLPNGNLKLKKGDIIVAFAQDGSRRYWGPYVVGETTAPVWDRKTSQWQLIIQP